MSATKTMEEAIRTPARTRVGLRARAWTALQSKRGLWWVAAAGALASLPGLAIGLNTDDHLHRLNVLAGIDVWSMFHIAGEQVPRARGLGTLAWWTSPDLSVIFFRPLASLTHWIDFSLWPDAAWLMHL